jgi:hypothetical protein
LHVRAIKDSQTYPTGLTASDAELQALNIVRDAFHGEWNYTIRPQSSPLLDQAISVSVLSDRGCVVSREAEEGR